ncbi:MAG: carboxylating nicotinate-nucleotide diphosphorylase [Spirulinaceae cyanobacterium SM2_1_0]|nr:carboxylating nicotinate-nucleotide diphosphorylase [Spirulinaceae cyanobacterium SM2_1_0]
MVAGCLPAYYKRQRWRWCSDHPSTAARNIGSVCEHGPLNHPLALLESGRKSLSAECPSLPVSTPNPLPPLPDWILIKPWLDQWLQEDLGRGDRVAQALWPQTSESATAVWVAKEAGVIAGLPIAAQVFQRLDPQSHWEALVAEGDRVAPGMAIARFEANTRALLSGERVALNLTMRLSGIATATRQLAEKIADLPAQLVDTRKTTPGLRLLEKYATRVGGAQNHRFGLDDAAMIKDNHIQAAGGIAAAVRRVRAQIPYPLSIEVETSNLTEVAIALDCGVEIIMLDNMPVEMMQQAVQAIRQRGDHVKIEASGNITLPTIRAVAVTGVDYISTSAPITRSSWLDLSMRLPS